jgi:hypothetical protein
VEPGLAGVPDEGSPAGADGGEATVLSVGSGVGPLGPVVPDGAVPVDEDVVFGEAGGVLALSVAPLLGVVAVG